MRNIVIIFTVLVLTACGSSEKPEPVKTVDNRTCSQRMYDLGETIQSLHYLGYSRRSAMDTLVDMHGPSMTQLSDFTSIVWSVPKGHWAKGEIGNKLRVEAIKQGCL